MENTRPAELSESQVDTCADLMAGLARMMGAELRVLDPDGRLIFSSGNEQDRPGSAAARSHAGPRGRAAGSAAGLRIPIRASENADDLLGTLEAVTDDARLEPLLAHLAAEIAQRFSVERDLDAMTDQLRQYQDEIHLLYRFNRAHSPDESFHSTARKRLEETADFLQQRLLVLYHSRDELLEWCPGAGCPPEVVSWLTLGKAVPNTICSRLAEAGQGADRPDAARHVGTLDSPHGPVHYATATVRVRSRITGFVGILRTESQDPFRTGEMRFLECLAGEISNTATTHQLYGELREMLFNTVRSLVAAIDAKDRYTRGHSERVYRISVLIGKHLGLSADEMQTLAWAALLHDIGKIAIRESILSKEGKLSEAEMETIRTHSERGCQVLEPIPQLRKILPAIRHHHERVDGKGYPDGLGGEKIPLIARILAVADSYDAMVSARSYRQARTEDAALREIEDCAGTQFDPTVATAFLKVAAEGALEPPESGAARQRAA